MYTDRQYKNEARNKVSRQVECGTRQRMKMIDERIHTVNIKSAQGIPPLQRKIYELSNQKVNDYYQKNIWKKRSNGSTHNAQEKIEKVLKDIKYKQCSFMGAHMIPARMGGTEVRPWLRSFEDKIWNPNFDNITMSKMQQSKGDEIFSYKIETEDLTNEEAKNMYKKYSDNFIKRALEKGSTGKKINIPNTCKNLVEGAQQISKVPKSVQATFTMGKYKISFPSNNKCTPFDSKDYTYQTKYPQYYNDPTAKKKITKLSMCGRGLAALAVLAVLAGGGYYFYAQK